MSHRTACGWSQVRIDSGPVDLCGPVALYLLQWPVLYSNCDGHIISMSTVPIWMGSVAHLNGQCEHALCWSKLCSSCYGNRQKFSQFLLVWSTVKKVHGKNGHGKIGHRWKKVHRFFVHGEKGPQSKHSQTYRIGKKVHKRRKKGPRINVLCLSLWHAFPGCMPPTPIRPGLGNCRDPRRKLLCRGGVGVLSETAPKLSNGTGFNDAEWPLTEISRSWYHSMSNKS